MFEVQQNTIKRQPGRVTGADDPIGRIQTGVIFAGDAFGYEPVSLIVYHPLGDLRYLLHNIFLGYRRVNMEGIKNEHLSQEI